MSEINDQLAYLAACHQDENLLRDRQKASLMMSKFREFIPRAWSVVEPSKAFMANWHIDAIADHLQAVADGQIQNLVINVPPGSAKSIIVAVMFPAWMWTPERNPGWRSTFASYDSDLSTRDSVRCRGLLESAWYKDTFRPTWKFAPDQNEKTYYVNSMKGFRVSTSVTGKGTGWRSSAIIVDDPLNAKERFSEAVLSSCIDWWDNVMFNRLDDLSTGSKVIIMQRLGDRDLSGHVLRTGNYEHLMIPMEYDPGRSKVTSIGWKDPRERQGELMFPSLFPLAVVEDLKKNPTTFAGQYQQSPNVEGGGVLRSHCWNYWQPKGMNLPPVPVKHPDGRLEMRPAIELPDSFDFECQSWDCAFKGKSDSDYVVGLAIGVRGASKFIRDQERGRLTFTETITAIRRLTGRTPNAHMKFVEDKANGTAVIDHLQNEIPGMLPCNPEGDKMARAVSVSPEVEAGNWYLPHPMLASWVGDPARPVDAGGFIAETVVFPFGANDDQVDAWSQAGVQIQKRRMVNIFGVSDIDIRVEPFDFDAKWPRAYGLFVSWQEIGAVWICRQPETGQHYLYSEYSVPATDPAQHAFEVKKRGDWISGIMTPQEVGRDLKDGYAVAKKYQSLGLKIETVQQNSDASIIDLGEALKSGKLKVFGSLASFFSQYRMFLRDDKGKIPQYNVGVIQAALTAWQGKGRLRGPALPPKPGGRNYMIDSPASSWMGN